MSFAAPVFKWILAILFIAAGALHFIITDFYVRIVPPVFPAPLFLVCLSGACEIVFGVLLLVPRFTRIAAWCLITLLIAVFPANIYMAMNPQLFSEFSQTGLLVRLPLQIVLMIWAFLYTKSHR